jgi:photosystem II stability/assembly factor-like uncharacterized protein
MRHNVITSLLLLAIYLPGETRADQARKPLGTRCLLSAVWGAPSGDLYAVGGIFDFDRAGEDQGLILRSTDAGKTWQTLASKSKKPLKAIWGSPKALYAVGEGGTILRSADGETWAAQKSRATETLFGVHGSSSADVYAVGARGLLLHSKDAGKRWEAQKSGTGEPLYAVFARSDTEAYAAGGAGTLLRTRDGGKTWEARPSGITHALRALWGSPSGELFAAGDEATLLRSRDGGESWEPLALPARVTRARPGYSAALLGLAGFSRAGAAPELVIVGAAGLLLRSADGGDSFTAPETGYESSFCGVWGNSPEDLYLVGCYGALFSTADGGETLEPRLKDRR